MNRPTLFALLCALLICLSTAEIKRCPRRCDLQFRCDPFYKNLVWSIVDGKCRVFQNGCFFGSANCNLVNSCKPEMVRTTRELCKAQCDRICPQGGCGVCATFTETSADGNNVWIRKTFFNRCLLDSYSCENDKAYIGQPDEGECPD